MINPPFVGCANETLAVSGTSVQIMAAGVNKLKRAMFIITNTSAAAIVTVAKGEAPAIANVGIILLPNSAYIESSDSGFTCWQGPIQAISDVAGNVSTVEQVEEVR